MRFILLIAAIQSKSSFQISKIHCNTPQNKVLEKIKRKAYKKGKVIILNCIKLSIVSGMAFLSCKLSKDIYFAKVSPTQKNCKVQKEVYLDRQTPKVICYASMGTKQNLPADIPHVQSEHLPKQALCCLLDNRKIIAKSRMFCISVNKLNDKTIIRKYEMILISKMYAEIHIAKLMRSVEGNKRVQLNRRQIQNK